MKIRPAISILAGLALLLATAQGTLAVLANAWHIPYNAGDLGFNMRNPEFEIGTNTTITVYSGLQKFNNSFGTANLSLPFSTLGGLINAVGPVASYTNSPANGTRYFRVQFFP